MSRESIEVAAFFALIFIHVGAVMTLNGRTFRVFEWCWIGALIVLICRQ